LPENLIKENLLVKVEFEMIGKKLWVSPFGPSKEVVVSMLLENNSEVEEFFYEKLGVKCLHLNAGNFSKSMTALRNGGYEGVSIAQFDGISQEHFNKLCISTNIRCLFLDEPIKDLSYLKHLESLEVLIFENSDLCIKSFENLNNLKVFQGVVAKNVSFFDACKKLQELTLVKYSPRSKNLSELPLMPMLKKLEINRGSLETLEGVEKFVNLDSLELHYLTKLQSLNSIKGLNVKRLVLSSCKKIVDFAAIGSLTDLESLELTSCGEIKDLSFLSYLNNLKFISFVGTKVISGDLSPLLADNIEYAGFDDSKGYSHTFNEVQQMKS
jgi:hypothetical protein